MDPLDGEAAQSWRALVIRLGERCAEYGSSADPTEQLELCVKVLGRNAEDTFNDALELVVQCAEELPHKAPLYATLVGLLNVRDAQFGSAVVHRVYCGLQAAAETEESNKLRILVRFLSLLVGSRVVAAATLVGVFDALLASAAATLDAEAGNVAWAPRADAYVQCVLAALPFCALELSQAERGEEVVAHIMGACERYMSTRPAPAWPPACAFPAPEHTQDRLSQLWAAVQTLQAVGWRSASVPRPWEAVEAHLAAPDTAQHAMKDLQLPPVPARPAEGTSSTARWEQHQQALQAYPPRHLSLRIFPASKSEAGMTAIDRFVIEEYLLDVLFYLNGCRKECAAYMVGLPVPFRYEYLMAEVVFSQLLLLPRSPFRLIYYTVVMVDLCKALPGAFPAVVAGAVRALFGRLAQMDVECRTRLIQWLSHHLSNFQFVWPWEGWAHVLEQPRWHPERCFVAEVVEKEVRLAYWDKVKESLGASQRMAPLMPPKSVPCYRYDAAAAAAAAGGGEAASAGVPSDAELALAKELGTLVRAKKTARDLGAWADEKLLPGVAAARGGGEGEGGAAAAAAAAVDVVVQTVLQTGAKSFTHSMTLLERYSPLLLRLAPDLARQVVVVGSAAALWANSAQMAAIVIDRCMALRIVSSLAITAWAFAPPQQAAFHTSDRVWEVLRNAVNKTNNRVADLRKEVRALGDAAALAGALAAKAAQDATAAEGLVERTAGGDEEARQQAVAKAEWAKGKAERTAEDATSAQESVEAKQALLMRALREQESLFLAVYSNFVTAINKRLERSRARQNGAAASGKGEGDGDADAAAEAGPAPMDADDDDDNAAADSERRDSKFGRSSNGDKSKRERESSAGAAAKEEEEEGEEREWLRCTLGQLHAISRHHAAEVWPMMKKLEAQVFTESVDRRIVQAAYSGLGRPL